MEPGLDAKGELSESELRSKRLVPAEELGQAPSGLLETVSRLCG
jgi:hypothetical protein